MKSLNFFLSLFISCRINAVLSLLLLFLFSTEKSVPGNTITLLYQNMKSVMCKEAGNFSTLRGIGIMFNCDNYANLDRFLI